MNNDDSLGDAGREIAREDELLELLYWFEGEGFGGVATLDGIVRFTSIEEPLVRQTLERLIARGDVLAVVVDASRGEEYRLSEPGRREAARRFAAEFAPALVAQAERQRDEAYQTLTAAHDAGVTLAMGFDSGPPGTNVLELMRMVDGGLTPAEAIVAATAGSARALGLADRGILEVGKVADLLAVDGDPLEEPGLLCDPGRLWLIARAGVPLAGVALAPSPSPR